MFFLYNIREERFARLFEESNLILLDANGAVDAAFVIVEDFHVGIVGWSGGSVNTFSLKCGPVHFIQEVEQGNRVRAPLPLFLEEVPTIVILFLRDFPLVS